MLEHVFHLARSAVVDFRSRLSDSSICEDEGSFLGDFFSSNGASFLLVRLDLTSPAHSTAAVQAMIALGMPMLEEMMLTAL